MFKKVFRIFNNGNQFGLNYQIQIRRTVLCFIHYWTTPDFAPPHCFDTIDEAKNCIYEEYPDAVIYMKCTDKGGDEKDEISVTESDEQSSNSPTGHGKYIDNELNKAAKRYFAENSDPNKYTLADVFYHGYRCGKRQKPIEDNQECENVCETKNPNDLTGLSGKEYNEKFIENIVSGKFLTCMIDFYIFKAGEKYWFEYIGNNNYIGRSDNILNEKIHLEPRQLDYFIEIKYGDEDATNVINWLYKWFYAVRTWGLTNNESNEEFCMAEAINAYKEFRDPDGGDDDLRYCIDYINPRHPFLDNGILNVRHYRALKEETAVSVLTIIESCGCKILDIYRGNVRQGKLSESIKSMIIDDDDWVSEEWLEGLKEKELEK